MRGRLHAAIVKMIL